MSRTHGSRTSNRREGAGVAPAGARQHLVAVVLQGLLTVVVLVLVFGFAIPRFADYDAVLATVGNLSVIELVWLVVVAVVNLATYWLVYVAALPGLRFWQAAIAIQTNNSIASTLPGGGAIAVPITYRILESWGFSIPQITELIGVSGFWNIGVKLALPLAAVLILLATGTPVGDLVTPALIAAAVMVVGIVLVGGILYSPSFARRIGNGVDAAASAILRPIHRGPITTLGTGIVTFRTQTIAVARTRWLPLTVTAVASQLAVFLVLLMSLRSVGVGSGQVSTTEVFVVFTIVLLASTVPITPGAVGVAEILYTGLLTTAGGAHAEVVAGVMLFRVLTYLIQIPIGGIAYLIWALGHERPARRRS